MAKTGYMTTWVPVDKADLKACLAQHQRVFPGNQLAIVDGYVKVAVDDKEQKDKNAIFTDKVMIEWEKLPKKVSKLG